MDSRRRLPPIPSSTTSLPPILLILGLLLLAQSPAFADWHPAPRTTWQYQLQDLLNTSYDVEMYNVDLFDVPEATIDLLHADGRVAIAHFSAGIWQDWRPDAAAFPEVVKGNAVGGWPGERWLDISNLTLIQPLMEARLDLAVAKGFDGVEPADMDSYIAPTGFPLTSADQLAYNQWLAAAAHARGLSVGLKNDLDQALDLASHFDWALVEEVYLNNDVAAVQPFLSAGKAVFDVEYEGDPEVICPLAAVDGISVLFKDEALGDEPPNGCDAVIAVPAVIPRGFALHPCAPNPFNPATMIRFDLPGPAMASMRIYDMAGRLVRVLLDEEHFDAGSHQARWDGRGDSGRVVGAGIYFCRLATKRFHESIRLTLIK